jgi:hypothetical protein
MTVQTNTKFYQNLSNSFENETHPLNRSMDTSSLNAFISCTLKEYVIKLAIHIILE